MSTEPVPDAPLGVLVVDDTPDLRDLLRMALERRGEFHVVAEASNGREGIELARAHQPDLVLLDISMPVMDGLEALPQIRAACPRAAVVMLSGFGATEMTERALARGPTATSRRASRSGPCSSRCGATSKRPRRCAAPGSRRSRPARRRPVGSRRGGRGGRAAGLRAAPGGAGPPRAGPPRDSCTCGTGRCCAATARPGGSSATSPRRSCGWRRSLPRSLRTSRPTPAARARR